MFEGYVRLGSTEIINSERTEAYCAHQAPRLPFKARFGTTTLHIAAEDEPYESPQVDDAPWFDPATEATADFLGLYPLDVTGVGDSTLTVAVTESVGDGGTVGTPRDASRTIRIRGVLIGLNRLGAEAGLAWLREAVRSDECSQVDSCGAGDFIYYLAVPDVCAQAYGTTEVSSVTERYGAQRVGTLSRQWQLDEVPLEMPMRARWTGTARQGTRFVYGAKHRFTGEVLEQVGPVLGLRRNYVPNPSFRADTDHWGVYNDGVVSWMPNDGADGLGYAHLDGTAWVDPGTVIPEPTRIYGEGVFGEAVYGGDVNGGLPPAPTLGNGVPQLSTVLMTVPVGPVTATVSLRGGSTVPTTLALLNPDGTVVASRDVQANSEWQSFTLHGTITGPVYFTVATISTVDLDTAMLEIGATESPYFDGHTPDARWDDVPDESASTVAYNVPIEIIREDGNWRPFLTILEGGFDNLKLQWWQRATIDLAEQLVPYERTLHGVSCTQGVQVINRIESGSGAYFVEVDFILTAGNPHAYSIPSSVITTPLASSTFTDEPVAVIDDEWLFDPTCLVPSPPPTAPTVAADCIDDVMLWTRYYVAVPAQEVALWSASVPTVGINSKDHAINQIRVRLHPNPFGYTPEQVDPLSFCSEFIVSFLPPFTRLVLNGMTRRAFASKGGKATVAADHLLYGSAGGPMSWPELSCGVAYVLTVDVPRDASINDFDIDLKIARRE